MKLAGHDGGEGGRGSSSALSISSVMQDLKEKFKNDEDDQISPFQGLDKATVLQETKIFSDANIVTKHPKKCCQLITKLLHILTQGEPFTSTETTDVFFGVTKLFQSKDANLRRMMYLFIKEVAEATAADEVIIVTQSLTKDMSSDVDLYRANAIRVLCRIIDGSMLTAIERYMKQAIVDRNALVASSALVSGMHLIKTNPDVIRRWVNEVQEAVNSPHDMVQFHAVGLLYQIRQHDKLAVSKFITQLQKTNLRSNLATCLLIRYTAALLRENLTDQNARPLYQFLEKMLRHKNDMVIFEAARSICALPVDARDLTPAIVVLQLFLGSSKPTLRFAAVRTLNSVALTQPMIVTRCNDDMEALISDPNRSIATLAITTLLKTTCKGPTTSAPARYIRFIRNRVILENAPVRASAVSALAQFAIRVESLRQSVTSLLQCCKLDDDDEVRDRATTYLAVLEGNEVVSKTLLVDDFPMSVNTLQKSLEAYQLRPIDGPLTFDSLPHIEVVEEVAEAASSNSFANDDEKAAPSAPAPQPQDIAKELYKIPEFADLGPIFRSSKPVELTEAETEYVVSCVKHIFASHIVLQFNVLNTVNDQLLSNVSVGFAMDPEDVWRVHSIVPLKQLAYGKNGSTYVCLEYTGDGSYPVVQVANELKFKVHEVNPSTGEAEDDGFDEEYPMEDFEIGASDLMAKIQVPDFRGAWEQLGDGAEAKGSYGLRYKSLVEGVAAVIENLGMQPCENTAVPQPKAKAHILLLSGVFVGGVKVLVKSRISLDEQSGGMVLQMAVRSEREEVSQTIMDCIR
ncbi:TPA: hypothetical protein N0F65_005900 [Lagenidium giganteum]|uniref:Coatomer subunit gamma n=1 Tax=Lagenidium giganteum TaxID=4803 RepID=A0AAV2Z7B8_9STRA|nr:TPA: hypothetical protein N0F65_005900 [Lagenidium giganteum]